MELTALFKTMGTLSSITTQVPLSGQAIQFRISCLRLMYTKRQILISTMRLPNLGRNSAKSLPCFDALQWPDYSTTHIDATINGQAVVIQLWKGWCEKFLGLSEFPGGVGAEVGIYRRNPGRIRPTSLAFLPSALEALILNSMETLTDDELWWPFPELGARVEYTLINPITQEPFFSAGPETTYWLAKWMFDDSYADYQAAQGSGRTPTFSTAYTLQYRVNGVDHPTCEHSAQSPS